MKHRLNYIITLLGLGLLFAHAAQATHLVYYLVDESSSMKSRNLVERVRESITSHSESLDADTVVYLQFFSSSASEVMTWKGFTADQRSDFLDTIDREFKPHGNSRLFDTVAEAVTRIRSVANEYDQISFIIFSDGDDTSSMNRSKEQRWSLITPNLVNLADENEYSRTYFIALPGQTPKEEDLVEFDKTGIKTTSVQEDAPVVIPVEAPLVEFSAVPTQADPKEVIEFAVKNSGGPVERYVWDFGDGNSLESTESAVKHAYEKEGQYDVSVRAIGPDAEDSVTLGNYVQIAYSVSLVSSFTVTPEAPTRGEKVSFRSESTAELDVQDWYVNGNKVGEGSTFEWEPTEAGSYAVEFKVQLGDRSDSTEQFIVVRKLEIVFPESGFKVEPDRAIVGEKIQLSATSDDPNFKHEWYVNGKKVGEGSELSYLPEDAGQLSIRHVLRHVSQTDAEKSSSADINVYEPELIVPTLEASITTGTAPLEVKFTDASEGNFVTYVWDFGDGSTSSESNPSYTYTTPGDYSVSLTVTDQRGRSATSPETIQVVVEKSLGWIKWVAIGLIVLIFFFILLAKKKKEEA